MGSNPIWCLYEKKKLGHTMGHQGCVFIEERPCENTPEGGCLQAKERDLRGNQTC